MVPENIIRKKQSLDQMELGGTKTTKKNKLSQKNKEK